MSLDFIQICYSKIITFKHSDRTLTLNVFAFVLVQIVMNKFRGSRIIGLFEGVCVCVFFIYFFLFWKKKFFIVHFNIHNSIFRSENHSIFNEERIAFYLDTNEVMSSNFDAIDETLNSTTNVGLSTIFKRNEWCLPL